MPADPSRTLRELRELADLTSDERGAQRVAWTSTWRDARSWLEGKLAELDVPLSTDAAGNLWATLAGGSGRSVVIGSHVDSVPDGGRLDGALGVLAGLEVLRGLAAEPDPPPVTVRLVDWADEEGARFGRSTLGSSAVTGALDPEELRSLTDAEGVTLADALAMQGVELARMHEARGALDETDAYLELHIEQGPVLESMSLPLGVASRGLGVARHAVSFEGQAAHAGSTPMELRRDPLVSAARLAVAVRDGARRHDGRGTTGRLDAVPGIVTAVAQRATLLVDQRHVSADELAAMESEARHAAASIAEEEGTQVSWAELQRTEPVPFDPALMDLADEVITELAGQSRRLPSGPLHDATAVSRSGVPTCLLFVQSIGGRSHASDEDTRPEHIELAVRALDMLTRRVVYR